MECVLKDLIAFSKDGEWGKGEPFDDSVEMFAIRGTDFEDVRLGCVDHVPRRYITKAHASRKVLKPWDVILEAAGGTKNQITGRTVLLRPLLFSNSELPFTCASFSRFIRFNPLLCDPAYMFWHLQYLYGSGLMHAYHTQHTGVARFQWTTFSEREPLTIPALPIQRRIGLILSAYDELIHNSQRRIRILESMARLLYREWFVDFRFPGDERTPRVSSPLGDIPSGWEVTTLRTITTKIGSGATPRGGKAAYKSKGIHLIRSLNIYDYTFEFADLAFIDENQAAELDNVKVEANDILLNITGASVARCALTLSYLLPARVNQHVAIVRVDPEKASPFYVLDAINSDHRKQQLLALAQGGATREALTKETLSNFEIVLPPRPLMKKYDDIASEIHKLREVLFRRSQILRRTRDLLLPRLLSGELTT
jgi:type I restriction enzyme, S subunit